MTVHRLGDTEAAEFKKASLAVHKDFAGISPENKQVLDIVNKTIKQMGY